MLNKRYNAKESEIKWQEYWNKNDIYRYDDESEKEVYSIDTPPPTVSGNIHIGHIFSYTQAEIIARYQRMQGKNVFYPFGFDDNGLPTERLVEKEKGIRAFEVERKEFVDTCLSVTRKYEEEFRNLWTSMGFSVDWKLQYETINPVVQKISQKSFLRMAKVNRAYIKESPVLWCTTCRTSIAQAELETSELETTFNYIPFLVEGEELVVATTRPELLYGCVCLFVNGRDNRYEKYIGKKAIVPLYNYEIPLYSDDKVAPDKGTGVVMCATFGDTTDVEWYECHKLPYRRVIEGNGTISSNVPFIGGLKVQEAREAIIKLLKESNLLKRSEKLIHSVAIHERCGKPIEIIPSRQWYINLLDYKKELLAAGDKINWYPSSMKIRYTTWVENLKWDWCISRQRYFGIPFPVWYCEHCGSAILDEEEDLPVNPMETKPKSACSCGSESFIAETAVFDTWATSSVTPLINERWEENHSNKKGFRPMSLRTQAHEIIRTWAFYTIAKSLFHTGEIPWKDIMISGFVLAKKGEKISKSKDNASSTPKVLIDRYSADALRYWAAGAKLGSDTMFSEEDLKISSRFMNKLWNAASFSIMQLQDYKGERLEGLKAIDQWILEKLADTENQAAYYLDQYETGLALREIDEFFWRDFCDNYLEIVKDRLYKPEIHGEEARKSAQYALNNTLLGILKLYAIYVPHITEEIYQNYFTRFSLLITDDSKDKRSIHTLIWNRKKYIKEIEVLNFGQRMVSAVTFVRKYKSEKNISLKEPFELLEIEIEKEFIECFKETMLDLKACTGAKKVNIKEADGFNVQIS